jgi:hypothetical protein
MLCESWMRKFVTETLKGSFNLWIKPCLIIIGSLEPRESLQDLRVQNSELGILELMEQIRTDARVVLCNSIACEDEVLNDENDLQILDRVTVNELLDAELISSDVEERLSIIINDENEDIPEYQFLYGTIDIPEFNGEFYSDELTMEEELSRMIRDIEKSKIVH